MVAFYENKDRELFYSTGSHIHFAAHLHKHIELVYMLEGTATTYVDGKKTIMEAGDIFISFPNQIHQYVSHGPEAYLIYIFTPDLLKDMKAIFKNYIPDSPVLKNASQYPELLSLLTRGGAAYASNSPHRDLQIKGYLLAFFGELLQRMILTPVKASNLSTLQNILVYCSENYARDISLDTLAESLHISKYYISHLLKKKINMGFSDYVNSLRVSEACNHLLTEELSITEIAYTVGFNTIRTFNRAFYKHMGTTPTSFRNK